MDAQSAAELRGQVDDLVTALTSHDQQKQNNAVRKYFAPNAVVATPVAVVRGIKDIKDLAELHAAFQRDDKANVSNVSWDSERKIATFSVKPRYSLPLANAPWPLSLARHFWLTVPSDIELYVSPDDSYPVRSDATEATKFHVTKVVTRIPAPRNSLIAAAYGVILFVVRIVAPYIIPILVVVNKFFQRHPLQNGYLRTGLAVVHELVVWVIQFIKAHLPFIAAKNGKKRGNEPGRGYSDAVQDTGRQLEAGVDRVKRGVKEAKQGAVKLAQAGLKAATESKPVEEAVKAVKEGEKVVEKAAEVAEEVAEEAAQSEPVKEAEEAVEKAVKSVEESQPVQEVKSKVKSEVKSEPKSEPKSEAKSEVKQSAPHKEHQHTHKGHKHAHHKEQKPAPDKADHPSPEPPTATPHTVPLQKVEPALAEAVKEHEAPPPIKPQVPEHDQQHPSFADITSHQPANHASDEKADSEAFPTLGAATGHADVSVPVHVPETSASHPSFAAVAADVPEQDTGSSTASEEKPKNGPKKKSKAKKTRKH